MILICSRALSNVRVVPIHMDTSHFEITFNLCLQNVRMAILYFPGHLRLSFPGGLRPVS